MLFKRCKRGAGGAGAAGLVALITILIILYIVFLPAEERSKYLEDIDDGDDANEMDDDNEYEVELLLKHPGKMDYVGQKEVDHDLPSVKLLTKSEGTVIEERNSVFVKNALFTRVTDWMEFGIEDVDNVDDVLLSFNIKEKEGRLKVTLNDIEVFNQEIKETMAEPILFRNKYLKNKNTIMFEVSSPGVAFWQTNQYVLEDVKVTADITMTESQTATLRFIADSEEKNNVNRIRVKFVPDCIESKAGPLIVTLNGNEIYSSVPDCGTLVSQEFLPYYLVEGENRLEFSSTAGSYLIDRIQVTSKLKKARDFVYDFNINSSIYEDVQQGAANVNLSIEFADDEEDKEAEILINGRKTLLDQDERTYSKVIDYYVNKDYNYIKIIPKSSMYMVKLEIIAVNEED